MATADRKTDVTVIGVTTNPRFVTAHYTFDGDGKLTVNATDVGAVKILGAYPMATKCTTAVPQTICATTDITEFGVTSVLFEAVTHTIASGAVAAAAAAEAVILFEVE